MNKWGLMTDEQAEQVFIKLVLSGLTLMQAVQALKNFSEKLEKFNDE